MAQQRITAPAGLAPTPYRRQDGALGCVPTRLYRFASQHRHFRLVEANSNAARSALRCLRKSSARTAPSLLISRPQAQELISARATCHLLSPSGVDKNELSADAVSAATVCGRSRDNRGFIPSWQLSSYSSQTGVLSAEI